MIWPKKHWDAKGCLCSRHAYITVPKSCEPSSKRMLLWCFRNCVSVCLLSLLFSWKQAGFLFFLAAWNGAVTHVGHPDAFVAQTFRMAYCHLCLGGAQLPVWQTIKRLLKEVNEEDAQRESGKVWKPGKQTGFSADKIKPILKRM